MSDIPLLDQDGMLKAEREFLWPPNGTEPPFRAGIALSGGGVRAATVALGVLQVLAERNLLGKFQYLSSVSGGGYTGSALSWFWSQKRVESEAPLQQPGKAPKKPPKNPPRYAPLRFGADSTDFPFQEPNQNATPHGALAAENLKFLRNHGSYLTSGDGIGFAGLIIAVLRTILLSLFVWLPLLIFLFIALEAVDKKWLSPLVTELIKADCYQTARGLGVFICHPSFAIPLIAGALVVILFVIAVILFSFFGRMRANPGSGRRPLGIALWSVVSLVCLYLIAAPFRQLESIQAPMVVQIFAAALLFVACLMLVPAKIFSPANPGYFLRRSFEKYSSYALPIVVAFLFIGALPLIAANLPSAAGTQSYLPSAAGPLVATITLLSGVGTALYGYYLKAKSMLPGVAGQIFAPAGSLLFLSGLLLCSFVVAAAIFSFTDSGSDNVKKTIVAMVLPLVVLALVIGAWGSVNSTGLYRFYRDRLMETFMPITSAIEQGAARQSDIADNLSVADVVRSAAERGNRPYHLVNAHAILVNEKNNPKVVLRGGDNFLISPAVIGSAATGWLRTDEYIKRHGLLTLASAMAVSGAAANANAGYTGTGITRDRFVSAVMSFLNIRLGLWVGNPQSGGWQKMATYFRPVLTCGIFGYGHHSKATFLELSDGGHFENLGLYELIRRKLNLIVVVDAEQDSAISLAALVSSTNRVREDFGATIEFDKSKGPEMLLGQKSDRYPNGVMIAKSPFVAAKILYKDGTEGALIYIKSTMVKEVDFATAGYRAANPDFPHQTTADQFFDPDQFEAYRDLGKKSCAFMINEIQLDPNFGNLPNLMKQYGWTGTPFKAAPTPPPASAPAPPPAPPST